MFARAETTEMESKPILLPNVTISDKMKLRKEEAWLTGTLGNFEIFSTASEKKTREFVYKLHEYHQAFTFLFPYANVASHKQITLVLCDSADQFDSLMPLIGKRIDSAMVSYTAKDAYQTIFLINLNLGAVSISRLKSSTSTEYSLTTEDQSVDTIIDSSEPIRREYLHLVFQQFPQRVPPWVEEGVVRFFLSMKIADKRITWAEINREFRSGFNFKALLSMQELFAIGYDSPVYLQSVGGMFSSQSLALVHLCMFGYKGKYRQPLFDIIERSTREPVNEAMFKQIFGMDYRQMEKTISQYVDRLHYKHLVAPKKIEFPPVPAFELRPTTDAENGRIKGDVLRLVKRYDDANAEIVSPIFRKHIDARLLASLGLLEYETGSLPAARQHLTDAVAAKVNDVAAYITLARLRLDQALSAAGPQGALNVAQLTAVLTPLFAARDLQLTHRELYLLIAEAWEHSRVPADAEHLAVIDEGVLQFPRNVELIYKDAALKARSKLYDDARLLCDLGLKHSRDESMKDSFQKLKSSLPEIPAAPAAQK